MKLEVSGRYLLSCGRPFFWLGDTAWLLFEKLTPDEIKYYLKERAKEGFNVVQATILHTPENLASGKTACAEYFDKIAAAAEYAKRCGIFLALLPCWGSFVKTGIISEKNYREYAEYLGGRFEAFDNIIWILGGDIRGSVAPSLYSSFAKILKKYNPERLISFHPFGRTGSYRWFSSCDWLDFNMFQSGHRRYGQKFEKADDNKISGENDFEEDNYKYVREGFVSSPKPILDGEPSYEGIVQGLHDFTQPYWTDKDVRRYAYWSVFAGACGFTYGHNAVMQFHSFGDKDANYGVREEWRTALFSKGSMEMQYLKRLMLSVDFTAGKPCDFLVADNGEKYAHIACFAGENFLFAYDCENREFRLKSPFDGNCEGFELDPSSGKEKFLGYFKRGTLTFQKSGESDRVIILKKL